MLTCKKFLHELSEYLDGTLDPETRAELHKHVSECPNCWVVCDTTERTLKIYKGMEPQPLPPDVESRFMTALMEKCKSKRERSSAEETSAEAS